MSIGKVQILNCSLFTMNAKTTLISWQLKRLNSVLKPISAGLMKRIFCKESSRFIFLKICKKNKHMCEMTYLSLLNRSFISNSENRKQPNYHIVFSFMYCRNKNKWNTTKNQTELISWYFVMVKYSWFNLILWLNKVCLRDD